MTRTTARRGRPRQIVMPDPIPDTPENVARALLTTAPKKTWDFEKPGGAGYVNGRRPARRRVARSRQQKT